LLHRDLLLDGELLLLDLVKVLQLVELLKVLVRRVHLLQLRVEGGPTLQDVASMSVIEGPLLVPLSKSMVVLVMLAFTVATGRYLVRLVSTAVRSEEHHVGRIRLPRVVLSLHVLLR